MGRADRADACLEEAGDRTDGPVVGKDGCYGSLVLDPDGNTVRIVAAARNAMKLISWNVNGLRACMGKGFLDFVAAEQPDMLCLQETKMQPGQADVPLEGGYREYWNFGREEGYPVALFTKTEPQSVTYGLGIEEHDHEGRVITADYGEFYPLPCIRPLQNELKRLDYRMTGGCLPRVSGKAGCGEAVVIVCGDIECRA